jgi:hypothetical protein
MRVYLLFPDGEYDLIQPIDAALTGAGYETVHPGTVLVGESIVAEAHKALEQGMPIILFATRKNGHRMDP